MSSSALAIRFASARRAAPRDASSRAGRPVRIGGRPFRAPTGLPVGRDDRRAGAAVSIAVHAAIIALLLGPAAFAAKTAIARLELGAGGEGPAGGGGGGTGGSGGWREQAVERITFVAPPAPAPRAQAAVVEAPKVEVKPPVPVPPPVVTPKPVDVLPQVAAAPPAEEKPVVVAASTATSAPAGSGTAGGTGTDGSGGNGPGSGGGVGSGIGTGRGSGVGPGTGGGTQATYPPTPTEIFLPPFPVPNKVKGFHLIAEFDVDEGGKVVAMRFTETNDGDYNRKLRDILRAIRFRPGVRPDGTPVRMKTQIEYSF
jgi:periplasmic protein TonB